MIKYEIYKETEIEVRGDYTKDELYDYCERRTETRPELLYSTDDYKNATDLFFYEKEFCTTREENGLVLFDELLLTITEYEDDEPVLAEIQKRYIADF